MSLSRSNTPSVSITNISTNLSTSTPSTTQAQALSVPLLLSTPQVMNQNKSTNTPSESSTSTSVSQSVSAASWECYECGFFNYDDSSICQACFKKCLYCDDDESDYCDIDIDIDDDDESVIVNMVQQQQQCHTQQRQHQQARDEQEMSTEDCELEDCEDCNSISSTRTCNNSKSSRSRIRSIRSCMLDIISFINNNSIKYEDSKRIMIHNVSESMANENLGNTHLFGVFGDVKKIEIIRIKRSNNIKAEITFYSADSVVALMKLSSSYHNYKIFSHY
eukprot:UN01590